MLRNASISVGSAMGSSTFCSSQRTFFSAKGTLCRKCAFALIKAAKAIRPQRLHDADIHVSVEVAHERFAIKLDEACQLARGSDRAIAWRSAGGRSALASYKSDAMSYCNAPLRPPW